MRDPDERGEIRQLSTSGQRSGPWDLAVILWFLPGAPLLFLLSELLWHSTAVTGAVIVGWLLVWVALWVMAYRDRARRLA